MNLENDYLKHQGMIAKVLGWSAMNEGEGVEPFLHACRTYRPELGEFSTWLWHNLVLRRKQMGEEARKEPGTVSLDDIVAACLVTSKEEDGRLSTPGDLIERQLDFRKRLLSMSDDAQTIVYCLLEGAGKPLRRKRINWSSPTTGGKTDVKRDLKEHCRQTMKWTWTRYWAAVREIESALKDLS
jgi:hypothetical protein